MINILSKETIDKIAAGEVAERPESVVKELLDNAIDSGADTVNVEVRNGGLDLIRVTDNGSGIEQGDVRNAFLRHATSKLKTAADIEHIRSMGFRGEALASIAAVSKVELITRNKNELVGTQYRIEGGAEKSFKEIGVPQGTTVIVRDFLLNVPVRRKFLKSTQLETSYIVNVVEKAALAYTGIAFSLSVDGRNVFSSSGSGRLKDVIYIIYGQEVAANLLQVDSDRYADSIRAAGRTIANAGKGSLVSAAYHQKSDNDEGTSEVHCQTETDPHMELKPSGNHRIHVTGFAARPVIARSRRDFEVFFVNGRMIKSDILRKAAEDAYAPYMMQHKYPMFVLSITLEPEDVDVNVHPRKTEVRFSSNQIVYDAVFDVLTKTLKETELIIDAGGAEVMKNTPKPASSVQKTAAPLAFEKNRKFEYVSSISEEIARSEANGSVNINNNCSNISSYTSINSNGGKGSAADNEVKTSAGFRADIDNNADKSISGNFGFREGETAADVSNSNNRSDIPRSGTAVSDSALQLNSRTGTAHHKDIDNLADTGTGSLVSAGSGSSTVPAASDARHQFNSTDNGKVFMNKANAPYFRMIGQVFETYWIIEFNDEMYIIDQHAAHEKVNFEHFSALIRSHSVESQMIFPPIVLTLGAKEAVLFDRFLDDFAELGYEIEYAGDRDYIVRAVPSNLPQLADKDVLMSLIDGLFDEARGLNSQLLHDKLASMSCKAAIKGNMVITEKEMRNLIGELLTLDNPYACPHGRPTIIKYSRTDLDKLFKRIVD